MIEHGHRLPLRRQAELLGLSRLTLEPDEQQVITDLRVFSDWGVWRQAVPRCLQPFP